MPAIVHKALLRHVGAGLVAARKEGGAQPGDGAKRLGRIFRSRHFGWIGYRADDDEVVVHQIVTPNGLARVDETLESVRVVDDHHVDATARGDTQDARARARQHPGFHAGPAFELGQK
jgi:hypothetical protein